MPIQAFPNPHKKTNMTIVEQMESAKALLKDQGQGQAEVDYFEAYANAMMRRSLGLFTNNFSKLLAMAQERGDPDSDTRAAYSFGLKCKMDASDINIADLEMEISYSQITKEKAVDKTEIHPDHQGNLPLSDQDTEVPEDEPFPEQTGEIDPVAAAKDQAEAGHEDGPVV